MAEKLKTDILISNGRLSYFYGFKPYEGENGQKSYCTHIIVPTNHPQLKAIEALIRRVAVDEWKDKAEEVLQQLKAQDKLCLHRGNINKPGIDAYKDKLFISSNSAIKPRILATVDGVNQEIDESHDFAPYSGCLANVIVNIWAQNNKFGKRINAQLMGVQFVRHGDRLGGGGRVASLDEFGVVSGGEADGAAPGDEGSAGLV